MNSKPHIPLLFLVLTLLVGSSCTRYRNIVYLQETDSTAQGAFYPYNVPEYRIQKRDVLYIKVISLNKEATEMINATPVFSQNMYSNDASFYLYGYNVNDSGNIELPIIGEVNVVGKTMEEAKEALKTATANFLKDATIIVKLISFKYSVLGEVARPGVYTNFNNQLTVLEAISQAGDINEFGNRKKVMVLRPTTKGTQTFRLDLTKTEILKSEGFFLLPNDIVYIEPVKSRNFRNNIQIYSLFLSTITTFILVLNYISK